MQPGSSVLIDGRRVAGSVRCTSGGGLPDCPGEAITIELDEMPAGAGVHLLQVQTPGGMQSNELPIRVAPQSSSGGSQQVSPW